MIIAKYTISSIMTLSSLLSQHFSTGNTRNSLLCTTCCYINDVVIKCLCGKFICEACTPWNYEYEEKMSVIEAHCPVCMEIVYHVLI